MWKPFIKYAIFTLPLVLAVFVMTRFIDTGYSDANHQLAVVKPVDFDIQVHAIGTLDAAESQMISSEIKGDKGKIIFLIEDGTRVEKGDVLVRLDPTPYEADVKRFEAEVLGLEASVEASRQMLQWEKNQVEREIRSAEYNLKVAELELRKLIKGDGPLQLAQYQEDMQKALDDYERYVQYVAELQNLERTGYGRPTEIALAGRKVLDLRKKSESARTKYLNYKNHVMPLQEERASAAVENAEMEIDQMRKGGIFRIAKAVSTLKEIKGKLAMVQDSLAQARDDLSKTVLKSPISAIAILFETHREGQKRKPRVGDRVWQNQPLLYLPDISSMIVKTQVREIDLHKIILEQSCHIQVDAYPDILFQGEVTFVGILARGKGGNSSGEKYFQLTILVKDVDERLRPGMTARVTVMTAHVQGALSIPIQAVFNDSGRTYCFQYRSPHYTRTDISIGRRNEDWAEIVSGLQKGDRVSVIKPSPDMLFLPSS